MFRYLFQVYGLFLDLLLFLAYPFLLLCLPRAEKRQRLGFHTPILENTIWLHAASVGEVNASKTLIHNILKKYPEYQLLVTTTSMTGQQTVQAIDKRIITHLLPLDVPFLMMRFIMKVDPVIFILIETELWPSLLVLLQGFSVPVIWVNARVSERSFSRYKRLKPLWKMLRHIFAAANAQSVLDATRLQMLGFKHVQNTHNLKFAMELPAYNKMELRQQWQIPANSFVLVFGSSRPGEEEILQRILPTLQSQIPHLQVILVPRHLNRLEEVKAIFAETRYGLYSEEKAVNSLTLVDKMGILTQAYALADIAIVGGSFTNFGGHNPLEPAFYGLPVIMGEFHSSCHDSVDKLRREKAIIISNQDRLAEDILALYHDAEKRNKMGLAAKAVMNQYAGSLTANLHSIDKWLERRKA
jgi:3-deoxy-D-manno-octulosonic-acid transferase